MSKKCAKKCAATHEKATVLLITTNIICLFLLRLRKLAVCLMCTRLCHHESIGMALFLHLITYRDVSENIQILKSGVCQIFFVQNSSYSGLQMLRMLEFSTPSFLCTQIWALM